MSVLVVFALGGACVPRSVSLQASALALPAPFVVSGPFQLGRSGATIGFRRHMTLVGAGGRGSKVGRTSARAAGRRFYPPPWLAGTATNWQNHHLRGSASFTVELPAGSLSTQQVRRQVHAVLK